jgi:hypothetical protein
VVAPERVWLTGARGDVLRLQEVVTERVDIAGQSKQIEKQVRLALGGGHVWMEADEPVVVRIQIDAVPMPEPNVIDGTQAEAQVN